MTLTIDYPGIGTLEVNGRYTQDTDGAGELEESYEVWEIDRADGLDLHESELCCIDIDHLESLCLEEIHRQMREYDPT